MNVSGQAWDSIAGEDGEIQMEELNQLFNFILSHNPIQINNIFQPKWGYQHTIAFLKQKVLMLTRLITSYNKYIIRIWPGLVLRQMPTECINIVIRSVFLNPLEKES